MHGDVWLVCHANFHCHFVTKSSRAGQPRGPGVLQINSKRTDRFFCPVCKYTGNVLLLVQLGRADWLVLFLCLHYKNIILLVNPEGATWVYSPVCKHNNQHRLSGF